MRTSFILLILGCSLSLTIYAENDSATQESEINMTENVTSSFEGIIPTDLKWQYLEVYSKIRGYGHVSNGRLKDYSIKPRDNQKYPYAWVCGGDSQWYLEGSSPFYGSWEYVGEKQLDETQAYLREEDGKVYISLKSLNIPKGQPYYWYEGQKELSIYNEKTDWFDPYTPAEDEEVVLYDYTAKVGDRYRTLILGSVICDVTVVRIIDSDQLPEELNIPGGVEVIEVLSDYWSRDPLKDVEEIGNGYIYNSIKYTRGIGNIGTGDYLFLSTLTPKYELDDGSLGRYCLNELVDKDG